MQGFCNSLWLKLEGEEAAKKKIHHKVKEIGVLEPQGQPLRKHQKESYYTRAKRVSRLHDLLSRHHKTNGEGVQVPVGDIPQVDG